MIRINLLPRKGKPVLIGKELGLGIISLILIIGAGIFLYFRFNLRIKDLQQQIKEIEQRLQTTRIKVAQIKKLKKDKKELENRLNLIKEMKAKQKVLIL